MPSIPRNRLNRLPALLVAPLVAPLVAIAIGLGVPSTAAASGNLDPGHAAGRGIGLAGTGCGG